MAVIRLHHLSDFHIGTDEHQVAPSPFDVPRAKRWEWYLKFLRERTAELPLAVILSGDLTSRGGADEFNEAKKFVSALSNYLRRRHRDAGSHVCVVPGNHDLDRRSGDTFDAMIRRFKDAFLGIPGVVSPFSKNPYLHFASENVLIGLVNTCRLGSQVDRSLHAIDQVISALLEGVEPPDGSPLAELRRRKIHDPGYVDPTDLDFLGALHGKSHAVKIAVLHHNLGTVPEEALDAYHTVLNSGFVKQRLQEAGVDVVLSGHRHALHCAYEEHWGSRLGATGGSGPRGVEREFPRHEGVYFLTAPTFSSRDGAGRGPAWLEISIDSEGGSHQGRPPCSLVTITAANPAPDKKSFVLEDSPRFRFPVDKPIYAKWRFIQERLERDVGGMGDISKTRHALETFWLPLVNLQGRLDDWDREEDNWQEMFHGRLSAYRYIYGIDLLGPETWLNPRYLLYVLKQFAHVRDGAVGLRSLGNFSEELQAATSRTNWNQKQYANKTGVEIARILIWSHSQVASAAQRDILQMVDSLHRLFGVPLLVLDRSIAKLSKSVLSEEFVLGLSDSRRVHRAYVYRFGTSRTREASDAEGKRLLSRFYGFLRNPALKTATDFIEQRSTASKPPRRRSTH